MSDINVSDTDPLDFNAVITGSPVTGYVVTIQYGSPAETVVDLIDTFETLPTTLTLNVDSSTVPSGYSLSGSGGGTWTNTSASSLSTTLTLTGGARQAFNFTISLVDPVGAVAALHDPRVIVKKLAM